MIGYGNIHNIRTYKRFAEHIFVVLLLFHRWINAINTAVWEPSGNCLKTQPVGITVKALGLLMKTVDVWIMDN